MSHYPRSTARALDVIGESWTPLIVRDISMGLRRFDEIHGNLGIPRKALTERLDRLVQGGVLERSEHGSRPGRHEYVLTEQGRELVPVVLGLMAWGDRWKTEDEGPSLRTRHTPCGQLIVPVQSCPNCKEAVTADNTRSEAAPGARPEPGTREKSLMYGFSAI
jgi:DNA-binding HxlR family transcriptional regulator